MSADQYVAAVLVTLSVAALVVGVTVIAIGRKIDAAWTNPYLDADPEFDQWVEEALLLGSETPMGDATAAHIAAQLSAHLDDEWKRIGGGAA